MRILDEPVLAQPPPVRLAFLEVLHHVMHVDGLPDPEEQRVLDEICLRMGLEGLRELLPEQSEWRRAWGELLAPIAPTVMLHAAVMVVADGRVHGSERVTLEKLAMALGCDTGAIDALLAWAEEGRQWCERGLELFERPEVE
jgi:uncharacterized tellurite resistance protein B-like protein